MPHPKDPGVTPQDRIWLQEACDLVKNKFPENYSFLVFAFPKEGDGRTFYASNATRESAIEALKVWLKYAEEESTYGTHVPERKT
jgi:hypothetical protein